MRTSGKVRVAIIGVGNCASSLVQGVCYYKDLDSGNSLPMEIAGIMHKNIGGYGIGDIEFSAAFDVADVKVGKDLSDAVFTYPNNTYKFCEVVPRIGVEVQRGKTLDGLGKYLSQIITESHERVVNVRRVLRDTKTDVVVNFLPVGSQEATKWYVEQILAAGCAFVNCIPVFIASDKYWQDRFIKVGLPVIGDDIKSLVGATIVHRVLASLFQDRGVRLDKTMQLNVGGNTDFLNMLERERLESKKISKTQSVQSVLTVPLDPGNVHIGPSDYVPWLTDRKWAYIRLEGTAFGDVPLNLELKLEVWDSPNSAGIVVDAVRCAKIALDRKLKGPIIAPSAYFMKSPPHPYNDNEARELVEEFIVDE